jgi:cytochrome-b5 reductase
MFQILRRAFGDDGDKTLFRVALFARTPEDLLLATQLKELEKQFPDRLKVTLAVEKDPKGAWRDGVLGRADEAQILKAAIFAPLDNGKRREADAKAAAGFVPAYKSVKDSMVLVCGPPGMMEALTGDRDSVESKPLGGLLKKLGFESDEVFKF